MSRQETSRVKQLMAVVFTTLLVFSTISGVMFTGAAAASTQQPRGQNPLPSATSQDTQESLGDTGVQAQTADIEPVTVTTTIQDFDVTVRNPREIANGRYNISGLLKANQPKPLVPVGHSVSVEMYVFENGDDTLVAHDEQNIRLKPGSVHPHKIKVNNNIIDLDPISPVNTKTSPLNMSINATDTDGDSENEYVVINDNGTPVVTASGGNIVNETKPNLSAVRDPYTSDFGFNLALSKNTDYRYELYVTGSDASDSANDYDPGENPANASITPRYSDIITVTDPVSSTDISSYHSVMTNTRYRNGSDVTFTTSYKSTRQQSEKEIYEELALPTRGPPAGTVTGFANAADNNSKFAAFKPNNSDTLRITTSTQTIPANAPQTLAIRYVTPGDGNVSVIPIDSSGYPIEEGRNSGKSIKELGYILPNDTSTVDYATGTTSSKQTKTNVALIQLSNEEREYLNTFGELFLSFEAQDTSDSFRLYCQSVLTGTVNRNTDACGINASSVDNYSNGIISNLTIHPQNPDFPGEITDGHSKADGVLPGNSVDITAKLRNAGTEPITNQNFTLFRDSDVTYESEDTAAITSISAPTTETVTLSNAYPGEEVSITSDLDSGDGTINITVSNNNGDKETFIYDGHQGKITEQLDGMSASDTWTVEVTTEMRTGQRDPEVNSIVFNAQPIDEQAGLETQPVTLDPGETTTVTFTDVPSTNTELDQKVTYTGHFYDNKERVVAITNAQSGETDSPEAVISGRDTLYLPYGGTERTRTGTQTVESTTCPNAGTVTCPDGSSWSRTETNVGTASGDTQTKRTTETGVPLNRSMVGTGVYDGNLNPLDRGGVEYPYKNLPGDSSEWTLQEYGIVEVTDSESAKLSETEMEKKYGSLRDAYKAGWTVSERNVGQAIVDREYAWFRAIDGGQSVSYSDDDFTIDRTSDEWTQITREEYSHMNISEPLTKTQTVDVETRVQHENPNDETLSDENWVKTEKVEHIVNRSYDAGTESKEFYSDPGGAWEFNDTWSCRYSASGCTYTRPMIEEEYWTYEWTLKEERNFRLHQKTVTESRHTWTRDFYETQITWTRTLSGDIHEYTGPEYSEFNTYGDATSTFNGKKSQPSGPSATITDYEWSIDGEDLNTNTNTYTLPSETRSIITRPELDIATLGNYEETEEFNLTEIKPSDSDIRYQPSELTLELLIDDMNQGSVQVEIEDNGGRTRTQMIYGREVPADGRVSLNLGAMGFPQYSEEYTVRVSGTASGGESVPAVNEVTLTGEASRGGDSISVSESGTGTMTVGLTVTDSNGFTDTAQKEVDIERCKPSRSCDGGDPWLQLEDHSSIVDYRGGLARVKASVGGIEGDDFYVVELTPGDIGIPPEETVQCPNSATKMTASDIQSRYDSWSGLNESQVVEENNPYCVYQSGELALGGASDRIYIEESQGYDGTPVRTVWEGSSTAWFGGDDITFNIDPQVNSVINRGETEFKLTLREVGSSQPEQTWNFDVFFCDALNNNENDANIAPSERETRFQGGLMCPNLNSDFDDFLNNDSAANDGIDACPYNPGKQNFTVEYGPGERYCGSQIEDGQIGIPFDTFDNPQDASKHMVYYNRYNKTVNINTTADGYSNDTLKLGYSPLEQGNFENNHLLAYYPLSENKFNMDSVLALTDGDGGSTSYGDTSIDNENAIYDISHGGETKAGMPGGEIATPWAVFQTVLDDKGNLSQYPYENLWVAADLSGNNNHAPIFHSQTRINNDPDVSGFEPAGGRGLQDIYRGDMGKMLSRQHEGAYGSGAYRFEGQAYFVPYSFNSSKYENNADGWNTLCGTSGDGPELTNGDNTMCYFPRWKAGNKPVGGPGWNQEVGQNIKDTQEFTVSMYIKPGVNTGQGSAGTGLYNTINTTTFFSFYDWNGFADFSTGVGKGSFSKEFEAYSTESFYKSGYRYNNFALDPHANRSSRLFGSVQHESHGWPDLPAMVKDPDNNALHPLYTKSSFDDKLLTNADRKRYLTLAMSQSYKTIQAPPEMKSLRANQNRIIRQNPDSGLGTDWRHMAVSADKGEQVTYYIDGLPYIANLSAKDGLDVGGRPSGEFSGLYGTDTSHLVGTSMYRQSTTNYLQDFYLSDYRMYDTSMSQSQVREHLLIDNATYTSRTQKFTDNLEEFNINSGDATKEEVVNEMLQTGINPDNLTLTMEGALNGGAVNVVARPVASDGSDINKGNLTLSYNATTTVENKDFFGTISFEGDEVDVSSSSETEYLTQEECEYQQTTCLDDPTTVDGQTRYPGLEKDPLPSFVGQDILYALDNGTINLDTAYKLAQHYDKEQYYMYKKRAFWQNPLYFSAGDEVTLEDIGISSQRDFAEAVGYERTITKNASNNLQIADDEAIPDNWEIEVELQSRPHTHKTPSVDRIRILTYDESGSIRDCSKEIYRC